MKVWMDIASFLILVGLLVGCSATPYKPGLQGSPQMSVAEARSIVRAFNEKNPGPYDTSVELAWTGLRVAGWHGTSYGIREVLCRFDQTTPIEEPQPGGQDYVYLRGCRAPGASYYDQNIPFDSDYEGAKRFADAFYVLKQNYLAKSAPETPQQQAAFEAAVKQYRATQPPPALPEEVRRYMIQAESAVKEKRFFDAVDAYDRALHITPWWPQAHFNLALLYGELEEYAKAQTEMNKYLMLVPDASNLRAAKDKIYEWEAKVGSGR